jgi:hypothetical protein
MGRIIINNKSDLPDVDVVYLVARIINNGRVSNNGKQYCYLATHQDDKYHIVSDLRKRSDSFIIYNNPQYIDKQQTQSNE